MSFNIKKVMSRVQWYIYIAIIVTIALAVVMQLWNADIEVPFEYTFDVLGISTDVKRLAETGKLGAMYEENYNIAAPYSYNPWNYYAVTTVLNFLFYMANLLFDSYGAILNIIYLFSYILVAWCCFYVLRKLYITQIIALVCSILYSFLPYHFYRNEQHLGLGLYWGAPLVCLIMIYLYRNDLGNGKKRNIHGWFFCIISAVLVGLWDLYYLVFSIILVVTTGILSSIHNKSYKNLLNAVLFSVISLVTAMPVLFRTYFTITSRGVEAYNERTIASIEFYGMRLIQLILPIENHRLNSLAKLREKYDILTNLGEHESSSVSLGLIMSIGLVISVIVFLTRNLKEDDKKQELILMCGMSNIVIFAIATIGGVSSVIGFISSGIRCYNRMVVFIAFFSILACALLADKFYERIKAGVVWRCLFYEGVLLLLVLGIWDQTTKDNAYDYTATKEAYEVDSTFIKDIEREMEEGDMIIPLPLLNANEESRNEMEHYGHYKPYLHAEKTRWLSRFNIGSDADELITTLKQTDNLKELIDTLAVIGFRGIYIDTLGYSKEELEDVTQNMERYLGSENMISSSDGKKLFYNLRTYADKILNRNGLDLVEIFGQSWLQGKTVSYRIEIQNDKQGYIGYVEEGGIIVLTGKGINKDNLHLLDSDSGLPIQCEILSIDDNTAQLLVTEEKRVTNVILFVNKGSVDNAHLFLKNDNYSLYRAEQLSYTHGVSEDNKGGLIMDAECIQYGPYMNLEEGKYQIMVVGEQLEGVEVGCTYNAGEGQIDIPIQEKNEEHILYTVELEKACEQVEFLIRNKQKRSVTLYYILIERLEEE